MSFTPIRRLLAATPLIACAILTALHLANSAPALPELDAAPNTWDSNTWTDRVTESSRRRLSKPWEDARQIWNGLRTVQKHYAARERRNANPTPRPPPLNHSELNNLPIPAYMKELYWNISLKDPHDLETTTIRSLPALHTGEGCGFNFSVGNISQFEVLTRAELRIHMQQPDGSETEPVFLQLYHGGHVGTYKMILPSREGWIVFDVLSHVQRWRKSNHPNKNIHFHIIAYLSFDDLSKEENGKSCKDSSIKFDQAVSNKTEDKTLLMIYSRDLDVVKFNVSALIEAAEEDYSNARHRRQMASSEPPPQQDPLTRCGKHTLQINLTMFNRIWHLAQISQDALYPRTFNINICGGECDRTLPSFMTAQHSIILYYLHTRNHDTPFSNAVWGQCCAPVTYRSIETLFSLPKGEIRIVTLRDISVEECSCLSILERTEPPQSPTSSR